MMRRVIAFALCAWLLSLLRPALASPRHALLIGSNQGLSAEPALEFAESDAARLAQTFVDVGSVAASRVRLVNGRPLGEIKQALLQAGNQAGTQGELWLFISGHADVRGIHVQDEVWSWKALRDTLEALPARRLLVFVDACSSGSILTAKGFLVEPPLRLSVETSVRGRVLFASSGANELSYESRRLRGSPFAHFLATGLRGPADLDADGRISVAEMYGYVYSRTAAASLGGAGGPQHPEQASRFQGQGEWILAERRSHLAELRQTDPTLGSCYVLDQNENAVLGELRVGDPVPLALPPRRYRVKCLTEMGGAVATLDLALGLTLVESLGFESMGEELVVARGPTATTRTRFSAHAVLWLAEGPPRLGGSLSVERVHDDFAYGASVGGLQHGQFHVESSLLGVVPWWDAWGSRLELGFALGYAGSFSSAHHAVLLGPLAQLTLPLGKHTQLSLREEFLRSVPLRDGAAAEFPLATHVGVRWDLP